MGAVHRSLFKEFTITLVELALEFFEEGDDTKPWDADGGGLHDDGIVVIWSGGGEEAVVAVADDEDVVVVVIVDGWGGGGAAAGVCISTIILRLLVGLFITLFVVEILLGLIWDICAVLWIIGPEHPSSITNDKRLSNTREDQIGC